MNNIWVDLLLVAGLIGINAALAGSEMAFVSLHEGQVRRLEAEGGRGRRVAALARQPNQYLGAVQLGITLAGFLASATVAVSLSDPVAARLGFLGRWAAPVSVGLVTILVALISLVFGELVPKRIAMQRSERWCRAVSRPLGWFIGATRPMILFLSVVTDGSVRLMGGEPGQHRAEITDEDLLGFMDSQPGLDETQRQIVEGAFEIDDRALRHVLLPRNRVTTVDSSDDVGFALQTLIGSFHSRAPVVDGNLDHPIGQIHLRDLVGASGPVGPLITPILSLPETLSVLEALRQLQASRCKLAVVFDEHGGASGIITLQDLVEEVVGEIHDEWDRDVLGAHTDESGRLVIAGSFPLHDLKDVGIELSTGGDNVTIAGLVLEALGHIPTVGEHAQVEDYDIEVVDLEKHYIRTVRVTPPGGDQIRDNDRVSP